MRIAIVLAILIGFSGNSAIAEGNSKVSKQSIERAKGEELATAMGHYGRSRSLLIAAIREFDKGVGKASPEALLDTAAWRKSLIERAKDLERVLDPQPRVTTSGIKYEADPRLLGEASK